MILNCGLELLPGCASMVPERESIMTIQIAVLCDAATDYNGKLNLLGTFDTIVTNQLPAVHPQCSIALRLGFSRIEEGAHKVKMNFVDEDGKFVMPSIDMPVDVAVPAEANFLVRNFIINIQQLKFDKPGQYSIDIAVDGRQETSIPLLVKHQAPAEPGESWKEGMAAS
jgi:hypothetical protein